MQLSHELTSPVAPIPAHTLLVFLLQVGVLLLAAFVLGRLAVWCGMPAIVGELMVGVLLGPVLLAVAPGISGRLLPARPEQFHLLDAVGQIGLLLLVGITGMEIDFSLVRRRRTTAMWVSVAGLVPSLAMGMAVGMLVPASLLSPGSDRMVFVLFLGVALCVSAIPVVAKTLSDMGLLHREVAQITLIAVMMDDVVGWMLLSVVSGAATTGLHPAIVGQSLLSLALLIALAYVVGRPLLRAALRYTALLESAGPIECLAVVIIFLCAAGAFALGVEPTFGAFVAGMLINVAKPDAQELRSLRSVVLAVFAPLFFASAGLRIDLGGFTDPVVLWVGLVVLAVALAGKFGGAFIGAAACRFNRWEALALGAGMNARGVVQLVIAAVGLRLGVLTSATYAIVILVAISTSVMAPPILRWAMARVEQTPEEQFRALKRANLNLG